MKPKRTRRHLPFYPALAAIGLLAAACGPQTPPPRATQSLLGPESTTQPDAGPLPSDFIGGDVAFEVLPDGGTP